MKDRNKRDAAVTAAVQAGLRIEEQLLLIERYAMTGVDDRYREHLERQLQAAIPYPATAIR